MQDNSMIGIIVDTLSKKPKFLIKYRIQLIEQIKVYNYKTQYINNNSIVKYKSESVIINFYQSHDYMTGHLDDAELDQESPIFSYSIGLSCVFLIGKFKYY